MGLEMDFENDEKFLMLEESWWPLQELKNSSSNSTIELMIVDNNAGEVKILHELNEPEEEKARKGSAAAIESRIFSDQIESKGEGKRSCDYSDSSFRLQSLQTEFPDVMDTYSPK